MDMGISAEMDAIAAVVLGGTSMKGGRGTLMGTVIGAIIKMCIRDSGQLAREHAGSLYMVAVLVGDEKGAQGGGIQTGGAHCVKNLPAAHAAVDQNGAAVG